MPVDLMYGGGPVMPAPAGDPPLRSGSPTDVALGMAVGIDWLGAGLLAYTLLGAGGGSVVWERWVILAEARTGHRRIVRNAGGEEIGL